MNAPLVGTIRFNQPTISGTYDLTVRVWETAASSIYGESITKYPITIQMIPEILPCIPNWQCNQPLNGTMSDGCGNNQLNSGCNPIVESPVITSSDSNKHTY